MDVRRHITAGRLSELFGASQVETDTFIRTLGWRRVAEQELQLLSAEHPPLPRRVRRRGERLPASHDPGRHLPGVQPARVCRASTTRPRTGRRSTPSRGSRRWRGTSAPTSIARSRPSLMIARVGPGPSRGAVAGLSAQRLRPDRHRRVRCAAAPSIPTPRRLPTGAARQGLPEADADRLHRRAADGVAAAGVRADAGRRPLGRRGDRLQLLGRLGRPDRDRQADPGQRPAPGDLDPVDLRPGRAALPDRVRRPARSRSPASASPGCPVW